MTAEGEPIGGDPLNHDFGNHEGLKQAGQLTVRSEDETVYVEELGKNEVAIFTAATIQPPEVELLAPTEVTPTSARLRARVNPQAPEGDPPAWDTLGAFRCFDLSAEEANPKRSCNLPTGEFFQPNGEFVLPASAESTLVEATVEGLEPASEYALHVHVRNWARASADSAELHFKTGAVAPGIYEQFLTEATETSATVTALVNPHGAETGYRVEYVTRAQFEASEFAAASQTPEQLLPTGIRAVPVSVALPGLRALHGLRRPLLRDQHDRRIGRRSVRRTDLLRDPRTAAGAGLGLRERSLPGRPLGGPARLPRLRAVHPGEQERRSAEAVPGVLQAAEGPAGITFYSQAGIPGGEGAQDYPSFISSRGEGAWSTQGRCPPRPSAAARSTWGWRRAGATRSPRHSTTTRPPGKMRRRSSSATCRPVRSRRSSPTTANARGPASPSPAPPPTARGSSSKARRR